MWFEERVWSLHVLVWKFRAALESKFWVESTFLNKLQVSADSPSLDDSNWLCGDSYISCRLSLVFLSGGILNIITHGFSLPSSLLPKILCVFETEFPIGALAVLELLDQVDFKLP